MSQSKPLNALVFGAGAIGGYVGGSLALQGHSITFLEREHNLAGLRANGLRLFLSENSQHLDALSYAASIKEALAYGPFDIAIFALKSYDTAEALKSLKGFESQLPPFLCLQNGVDNEGALAEVLGKQKVIAGTVTTAIAKPKPGEIVLERKRGIGIGAEHPFSSELAMAMNAAGLNAELYADSSAMKWSKLLTNLLSNAQSAISNLAPSVLFNDKEKYALEIAQEREALQVMQALKLRTVNLPGTPVRALAFAIQRLPIWLSQPLLSRAVGSGRGAKMPSLHIDLYAGKRKSEVAWLNGAVVRWGKKVGLATPVNQMLEEKLTELVEKRSARVENIQ